MIIFLHGCLTLSFFTFSRFKRWLFLVVNSSKSTSSRERLSRCYWMMKVSNMFSFLNDIGTILKLCCIIEMDNNLQMQLKRKAEEEEKRKASRPSKRKKNNNNNGDAVKAMDRLMSAGGDTLPEDETPAAAGSSGGGNGNSKKKSRIGRPRTNISFTG